MRTPLVQLDERIWLKLENLQPIGSFKLRGALNARAARRRARSDVVTASAGNMAQGVAWAARETGVRARIVAPENAPRAKLDAVERLGGEVIPVPHEAWWQTMVDRRYEGVDGLFVHPVEDELVMAGNGTIGLELCEHLDEFDTVIIPWGGGGLTTGIASAVKALRPGTRVVTAEPETAAPLAAALRAGEPVEIDFAPSFVDGAGGRALLPTMWDAGAASSSTRRSPSRSTTSQTRCACSRRARASSPKARARSRSRPRRSRDDRCRLHRQRRQHRRCRARAGSWPPEAESESLPLRAGSSPRKPSISSAVL